MKIPGAGDENRTRVLSLGSLASLISVAKVMGPGRTSSSVVSVSLLRISLMDTSRFPKAPEPNEGDDHLRKRATAVAT